MRGAKRVSKYGRLTVFTVIQLLQASFDDQKYIGNVYIGNVCSNNGVNHESLATNHFMANSVGPTSLLKLSLVESACKLQLNAWHTEYIVDQLAQLIIFMTTWGRLRAQLRSIKHMQALDIKCVLKDLNLSAYAA